MASKRDSIIAAVVTALGVASVGGTTKPTGLDVHRMRTRPIQADALPAMVVFWLGDEAPSPDATSRTMRSTRIAVECRVAHPGTNPDAALDPLLVWATKAVLADHTLGGLASEVEEGRSYPDLGDQGEAVAAAAIEFVVKYQTTWNDPESA